MRKSIPGYEGIYEASEEGHIIRVKPTDSLGRPTRHGVLRPVLDKKGYARVGLSRDGKVTRHLLHRLICETFHGPPPDEKPLALHWDDDNSNNRASNLRWGDYDDNASDLARNGRHGGASKTHCPWDHPYSGDNLRLDKRGYRFCIACEKIRSQNRKKENKNGE